MIANPIATFARFRSGERARAANAAIASTTAIHDAGDVDSANVMWVVPADRQAASNRLHNRQRQFHQLFGRLVIARGVDNIAFKRNEA